MSKTDQLSEAARALPSLTRRERDVLQQIASGASNQGIAAELWLSVRTVERHVNHIFLKLGLLPGDDCHRRVVAAVTFAVAAQVSAVA